MEIRFGEFTFFEGIEMQIINYYGHGLSQEIEEKHRLLSYPSKFGPITNFILDNDSNKFTKDVLISELRNSFFVTTKVMYKNEEFIAWGFRTDTKNFIIYTLDQSKGEKLGFVKLSDRLIKEVEKNEITKIWEERLIGNLNLPFPNGLKEYEEINQLGL